MRTSKNGSNTKLEGIKIWKLLRKISFIKISCGFRYSN